MSYFPDSGMEVEFSSENLPFLQGAKEELKKDVESTILNDQQILKKIQRIRSLLGQNQCLDEWMYMVTCKEQLETLSRTQQDWTVANFHLFMNCISQLTMDEAERFFSFCRQNVVNKMWPEEYAMDLAKTLLTGNPHLDVQVGNQNDITNTQETCDSIEDPISSSLQQLDDNNQKNGFNANDTVTASAEKEFLHTETHSKEPELKDSLTIVFMGMSGSGKTTLVNGIANSFRFPTFEKALKSGPKVVVPTRFTTFVGSKARIVQPFVKVSSTEVGNENLNDGAESVTKEPMIHNFSYKTSEGKIPVRIVDTPGLNDTEGYDRDETNLSKTLEFLEKLDKIDSICIVLKANESRLTFPIESALKKLLRSLNRSTYKNISFVFTNDKMPGGSLAMLRKHFQDSVLNTDKENWFSFDNEPFRYLCTVKEYPQTANEERKDLCEELFVHNVEELKRLLQRAECLPSFKMPAQKASLGQTPVGNSNASDKITGGTSAINKTLWGKAEANKPGPSKSVSVKEEKSSAGFSKATATNRYSQQTVETAKEAADDEELKAAERIEHDRTCRIVEAMTEPLAEQIFDNCKRMAELSEQVNMSRAVQARLYKEAFFSCHSCNGQTCKGDFDNVRHQCRECRHHQDQHSYLPSMLDKMERADAEVALRVSAKEDLEREDDILHSACHQFSFFLTTPYDYPFYKCFGAKLQALERELYQQDMDLNQRTLFSDSVLSFLDAFRIEVEKDERSGTYGEFVNVENTKRKLNKLKKLKVFGPRATKIMEKFPAISMY